ncbi:MAG: hypothetical protein ABSF14_23910 [Terriglobia bacterium]|jgi:hypothetical protein
MNTFRDDELADVKPVQAKPATAPITPTAVLTPAPAPPAATTTTVLTDIDDVLPNVPGSPKQYTWDDEELEKDGDELTRIRPEKGSDRTIRFAVLPGPIFAHRNHFVPTANGKTCRLCLSEDGTPAICCIKLGEDGRMRIVAPALQYEGTENNGTYRKGAATGWKIGYVELSPSHFKILRNLQPEVESGAPPVKVDDVDIGMTYEKNRFAFRLVSMKARWKQIPEIKKAVEAALVNLMADGGKKLEKRLGKKTSFAEWRALLAGQVTASESPTMDNLEDLN